MANFRGRDSRQRSSPSRGPRKFSRVKPQNRSRGGRPGARRERGGGRGGRKMSTFNPRQFINKSPKKVAEEVYTPKHTFNDFGLHRNLVDLIHGQNISSPTPIQDKVIPEILNGNDVVGLAETGTGKTAAFLIPLIQKTLKNKRRQTLILTPTRELAIQIEREMRTLTKGLHIFGTVCVGGVGIQPQMRALKRANHFIIGTPGRILDLIRKKRIHPVNMSAVVLDEADRMLDMGFIPDMRAILSDIPEESQTLFFSATMTRAAEGLVSEFMERPVTISVKKRDVTSSIEQDIVEFHHSDKFDVLLDLLSEKDFRKVLIFGSMKHSVQKLSDQLNRSGVRSEAIHGNKNHTQRQRALTLFKEGKVRILVATDVAARGIHVNNVSHVINYDLPSTFEDYVHRIGRTGRGDKFGKALTFVSK